MKNLVEQFKEKLDSITPEEFEKSWREIENMGIGSEKPCIFDSETNSIIFIRKRNELMKQIDIKGEPIEINFDNFIKMFRCVGFLNRGRIFPPSVPRRAAARWHWKCSGLNSRYSLFK